MRSAARVYPARDPFPPSSVVKLAAEKAIKRATAAVATIKEVREALDADLPLADVFVRVAKSHLAVLDEVRRG
jgi:hypothetical protein